MLSQLEAFFGARFILAWLTAVSSLAACGTGDIERSGALLDASVPSSGGGSGGSEIDGGMAGDAAVEPSGLVFTEAMADNDGAWVDEFGEADDWLELANIGTNPIDLAKFEIADTGGDWVALPARTLAAGQALVLFADDEPEQGELHLPFKLSSGSDALRLRFRDGNLEDETSFSNLALNESWARFAETGWVRCRYASPGRANPTTCTPPEQPEPPVTAEFQEYHWEQPVPAQLTGLVLNELHLRPGGTAPPAVELFNAGDTALDLGEFSLTLAAHAPDMPWPGPDDGVALELPEETLPSGAYRVVEVPTEAIDELEVSPAFEGVATLFGVDLAVVDRVDFMRWPVGAALARPSDALAQLMFCASPTLDAPNTCQVLRSRDVGDRVRYLRTEDDFRALAEGASEVGIQSVKFVVDQAAPGLVHLLSSASWPLHYTFIREQVYGDVHLDRCIPEQKVQFDQGWYDFSVAEYFETDDARRFLLGTLSVHGSTGLAAVEYTFGDAINGEQMLRGFFAVVPHTTSPEAWSLRPQDAGQVAQVKPYDGLVPLVAPEAPFIGMTYQPLTEGVAFGVLTFVPATELEDVPLGPSVIVVTDDVPNDIPFVGGLITEAFQTPLAHVNVLSQSRGTPNAGLKDARLELAPFVDQLVRLEVTPAGLRVELTTAEAATEFWQQQTPVRETFVARQDTSVRGVQNLEAHSLESLPSVGAKAAQMAEMLQMDTVSSACGVYGLPQLPQSPLAVPLVHYLEHFAGSGASARLDELVLDPAFVADPLVRAEGLEQVRELILNHPVEEELLREVEAAVEEHFGATRVRFRSSSNTEDLPNFNGAGLYTSVSAELGDPERRVEDALRTVWASLWNARAYDERQYAGVDDTSVAMGVLIHPAFLSEEANGVSVSRNLLDPNRGDIYYVNVQLGEATVTNPAPGVTTDEVVYRWRRTPLVLYSSSSSLLSALPTPPEHVLTDTEVEEVACALETLHNWFRPLLDPEKANPWFAMEAEFKVVELPERHIVVKQTRPYAFSRAGEFDDCREL